MFQVWVRVKPAREYNISSCAKPLLAGCNSAANSSGQPFLVPRMRDTAMEGYRALDLDFDEDPDVFFVEELARGCVGGSVPVGLSVYFPSICTTRLVSGSANGYGAGSASNAWRVDASR